MEKPQATSHVSSNVSSVDENETVAAQHPGGTIRALNWNPGYRARFPWKGFVGLAGVLICALINIAILIASDGVSSTKWPERVAPHTIIGTVLSVSGLSLAMAIGEGISIAWWRKGEQIF
jgi:hypothetical protein